MADLFLTFKVFSDSETAQDIADVLKQNDIPYLIEEDALTFDASYANNAFNKDYRLKLRQPDFERANKVLDEYYHAQLNKVDTDYYLFDFADEELQAIVAKPDEWGHFDYQLAQKILSDRGKEIKPQETEMLRDKRIKKLSKPDVLKPDSILSVYVLCFCFFPVGLFIGWNWSHSKKTLPDGQRVYIYDDNGRKHGRLILAIGLLLPTLLIVWRVSLVLFDVGY